MILFKIPYTLTQYIGLGFLFLVYAFQGLKFVCWDAPRMKRRENAKLDEIKRVDEVVQKELIASKLSINV